jgi:hypothetical protein
MADYQNSWGGDPKTDDPLGQLSATQQGADWKWAKDFWDENVQGFENVKWMFGYLWDRPDVHSFIFGTDEERLARAIAEKTQSGSWDSTPAIRQLATQAAHRAMIDPTYRERVAQQLGWNVNNPHVAWWIKNGGGVPSDPTGTGINPATGAATKAATPAAAAASTAGAPFDPKAWGGRAKDPGFTYGALLPPEFAAAAGIDRQWGVDYALPMGTPQTSPFAGTVIESDFNGPYGNTVVVKLTNGYTYRVAHLQALGVRLGDKVGVGTNLGPTGSTGNSTGSHVLIEMRDPTGKPIDPTPILDSLLKGDNSGATKILGEYATAAASAPGPILTTDGHLLYPGSADANVFFAAQSMWRKRYGGDPPWSFISSLIAAGNTTAEQIQSQMDQMSSDIPGLNWGRRDALTNDANNAALKAWDRPVPDATIKSLASQGITTPGQIQGWVMSHPATALDKADFKTIYDQTNTHTQELWQQPPSPDLVKHIHDLMNQGPTSAS